ncbi:MAG: histidine--tRNA ligase [Archangiaceae bacterium]|nr:histidine--tRNA ligase [Archangiaceae bacterium]
MIQPRTVPGTLELLPREQLAFQKMIDTIRAGYERFGFMPIETPVFELSEVLLTKSGGETEKQLYFAQSTGALEQVEAARARGEAAKNPELALRFDLTVPLARYVAQYENQLAFPFRRYQIQRVYRGERNQKGRYREFYQCDIDVVGKDTLPLMYDAEMPAVISEVFRALDFGPFTIRINNRKLLNGLLRGGGIDSPEKRAAALREIDKLEKIGEAKVTEALQGPEVGMSAAAVGRLLEFLKLGRASDAVAQLEKLPETDELFRTGVTELKSVLEAIAALGVPSGTVELDLSIARGLDYYTGTIYETVLNNFPGIGSVCSGGRYDDLAGHYTKSKLPGVGLSIGLTRLFFQLREAQLLKPVDHPTAAYVTLTEPELAADARAIATELRRSGLNVELAAEPQKLPKQLKYADRVGIRFAVIYTHHERERGCVALKDLRANTQRDVQRSELAQAIRSAPTG